jgi:hypothetical protein
MRTKTIFLGVILMLITVVNTDAAFILSRSNKATHQQQEQRVMEIRNRVQEIKSMDMSTISNSDRKALKHELKGMRKELRNDPVVIVISGVGLLLLIVILLLLL